MSLKKRRWFELSTTCLFEKRLRINFSNFDPSFFALILYPTLNRLWDTWKDAYAANRTKELTIVE